MKEVLFAGSFAIAAAILGALLTIVYQSRMTKRAVTDLRAEQIATLKKSIINDLVAYRFVLAEKGNLPEPTMKFNAALSRIPIIFGSNANCIRLYRDFGHDFTPGKFHDLIVALMKDVPLETGHITVESLENVPIRRPV